MLIVWDVLLGLGVDLGQVKVNDVHHVLSLAARPPHQKFLGFTSWYVKLLVCTYSTQVIS